jgi:hypothetical protein
LPTGVMFRKIRPPPSPQEGYQPTSTEGRGVKRGTEKAGNVKESGKIKRKLKLSAYLN